MSAIAGAETVSLPSGCAQYFYVGDTTGGYPGVPADDLSSISWTPDLSVDSPWSGDLGMSIGRSQSNVGSFVSPVVNYAIAGVGIGGYSIVNTFSAQNGVLGPGSVGGGNTLEPGASLSLPFTTSRGDIALILVGGQGTGTITMSGVSASALQNQTYSEGGSDNFASAAIYSATLAAGSYTASFSSTSSLNTSGNALGAVAYILAPSTSPPPPPTTPTISSVSDVPNQGDPTIFIDGSGFGSNFPQADVSVPTDTPYLQISGPSVCAFGVCGGTWNAGYQAQGALLGDGCSVTIGLWSESQIVLQANGVGGLSAECPLFTGQQLTFQVWNTSTLNSSNLVTANVVAQSGVPNVTGV